MRDNKVAGTAAALVLFGSALAIVYSLSGGFGPSLDPAPHQAVGQVLARQTLSLLKPGGRIIVIARDTVTFQTPASEVQFAAFRKEVSKAGAKIDSVQSISINPINPLAVPSGDFLQDIQSASSGSVIVSLMGPPLLTEAQMAEFNQVKPAVVAFCPGAIRDEVDLRSLFAHGLLKAAVVSKPRAAIARGSAKSEQDAFDRQFVEVTPANLAALSSPSP